MSIKELLTRILKLQSYYMSPVTVTLASATIAAGGGVTVDTNISASIPSTYEPVLVVPRGTGSYLCYFYWQSVATNGDLTYQISNRGSSSVTVTPSVTVLCRKKSGGGYCRSPIFKAFSHLCKGVAV